MNTAKIPEFAFPANPDALALFETIALAGLEGQWIELSLKDQRRIMGAPVFGYSAIRINTDCTLQIDHRTGAVNPVLGTISLAGVRELVAATLPALADSGRFDLVGPRFWIDTTARRGCWERKDGTEGGELLFDRLESGALDLVDFDGAGSLPVAIVCALRSVGVRVSDDFT